MPLDRHAERLLAMLAATRGASDGLQSPQARRDSLRALADLAADAPSAEVRQETLACPGGDGAPRALRRYTPPGAAPPCSALVYLHGGGWVAGDLETHAGVCAALAHASGAEVFALDYRRPPEHPCPAAIDDALAALAFLRREAGALGLDPRRIAIGGDSAGANIAAAACLQAKARGEPQPALQLLICPILDPARQGGSRAAFADGFFLDAFRLAQDLGDYLGADVPIEDPRVAPLRAADLGGVAPALIHAAQYDPFHDEALAYAERLRAAGVSAEAHLHPGMIHYFYALPRAIPVARGTLAQIGADLRAALAR